MFCFGILTPNAFSYKLLFCANKAKNGARKRANEKKVSINWVGEKKQHKFHKLVCKRATKDAPIGKALFINKVLPSHRLASILRCFFFCWAIWVKLFIKNFIQMIKWKWERERKRTEQKTANLYLGFKSAITNEMHAF